MSLSRISTIFKAGVGRRILGLFLLAGLLPVTFTAFLAYNEVGNGLQKEVNRDLREDAKTFGIGIMRRVGVASAKSAALVEIIEEKGKAALVDQQYLLQSFVSVWAVSHETPVNLLYGNTPSMIAAADIDLEHLSHNESQLLSSDELGSRNPILLRGERIGQPDQTIYAFSLRSDDVWAGDENIPFLTDFCAFSAAGKSLYCTQPIGDDVGLALVANRKLATAGPVRLSIDGRPHFAAVWQLFLDGSYRHPAIDIVASQPVAYATMSGTDFRRIFTPALLLVVILVAALSFNFIGQSLVPLQRLTIVARQYAAGQLESRVRVKTGDEFEDLASAFNNMATQLGRQIATFSAMSMIDKSILSGTQFDEISEDVIGHLIELTGFESAAVIAKDFDSPNDARMISWHDGRYIHERIASPLELGHDWDQPKQVTLAESDTGFVPYRQRFLSFGLPHVALLPVLLNGELKGMLLLGSDAPIDLRGGRMRRSLDLAGRLAVALTSAEREDALYRQAHFDELTGLPNRQLLKDRLDQHLVHARRERQRGAMLFLDLDRFKEINDVFGHSVGDIVLTQAAERIVAEVCETDTVARLGGDEFVVVIPHLPSNNTLRMTASRILSRLTEPFSVRGSNHFLSASIGIVVFPEDGDSVETLLKNADSAMYRAKDAGRSRFEFFSKKLNTESRRKIELERDLREAFNEGRLEVYYQPQFQLSDSSIYGAEALMRWNHRSHGFIAPNEFIQLAEDSGLITEMGRWIIGQTCADLRTIMNKGLHPGSMSINVSARQLKDESFPADVMDALKRYDIHPGYMQLEITETAVAENRDSAINLLNSIRDAGVQIAIDDFGTGYSSLSYLQHLPFDLIKIDKSFIDMIGSGGSAENICRMIISMAHELGKKAIAEGVETAEQAGFLSRNKCDFVQGFHFSRPLPRKEFIGFVENLDLHTQRRKALEIA